MELTQHNVARVEETLAQGNAEQSENALRKLREEEQQKYRQQHHRGSVGLLLLVGAVPPLLDRLLARVLAVAHLDRRAFRGRELLSPLLRFQ